MILTQRLRLRQWNDDDLAPFAELNGDAETMAFMPKVLTRQESDDLARALQARIAERGWGLWAVEELATGEFVGFVGLGKPRFEASFVPCVEVGWRLLRKFWGNGYASEGGRASLGYGFEKLGLNEIVSFTTVTNMKSRRVM